jgi:CheY-like chemotaxis protein/anti-sigma regulatory factor (Ser/Thr protein kinase)
MSIIPHILIVDDEPFNIEIITELLDEEDYKISSALDGDISIKMLEAAPEGFDVIVLDRMMPNMNGMEVLARIQEHDILRHCPVIFQTAKASPADISEGLQAGAHYYLSKPFDEDVLLSVIKTAAQERQFYKDLMTDLDKDKQVVSLIRDANFEFSSIDHARNLASLLSNAFPDPSIAIMGLTELMVNAVEHGNLGIIYDKKSALNESGDWNEEVIHRLALAENTDKSVKVNFIANNDSIKITITDQGDGFDWETYMDFDPSRIMDNHGRGIAVANKLSFSEVSYSGKGNIVCAMLNL